MTKNTLIDLNDHLFEQLERLSDDDLTPEELSTELQRTDAVTKIADKIINNADLALKAEIAYENRVNANMKLPTMLENKNGE